ncbi:DUF2161 domain-containing phosphodiesterase [Paenibacillus marinisediminis]
MSETKMKERRKETDLYLPIKGYWEARGYHVKAEVRHCDIVALHPDDPESPVIIELKASINLTLVLQALERQKSSAAVYIAAELKRGQGAGRKRLNAIAVLCRRLGIGLMTVTFYARKPAFVEVHCTPHGDSGVLYSAAAAQPKRMRARTSRLVREFDARSGDYNVGGSTKQPLVTAYREKALRVAAVLQGGPNRPVKVRDACGVGDAAAILQRDVYGWFTRVERGIYALTPAGEVALRTYADVVSAALAAAPLNIAPPPERSLTHGPRK